jgi:hypothetical protein
MAGIVGSQDLWVVGSRAYFQREGAASLVEIGTINAVSPAVEPTKIDLREYETGLGKLFDSTLTEFTETYEVTTKNFFRDNIANLFLSSAPVTRSNPLETAVENRCVFTFTYDNSRHVVGTQFLAVDNGGVTPTGQVCYNMASVTGSGALLGSVAIVDAARGIFQLTSVAGLSNGSAYSVTIALDAPIGNNRQVIRPQTATLSRVTGEMLVYFERNNGEYQSCRNFKCILQPSNANFQIEDYSEFTFTAKALYEPTKTAKFGKFITYRGSVI